MARRDEREYREYLNEEQRSQTRGPQRGSRVGVEEGCIAGRMQSDFYHGLLGVPQRATAAVMRSQHAVFFASCLRPDRVAARYRRSPSGPAVQPRWFAYN